MSAKTDSIETYAGTMPTFVNGKVGKDGPPRRQPNSVRRPREWLTEAEIERLIAAARQNRHGHRDAPLREAFVAPPLGRLSIMVVVARLLTVIARLVVSRATIVCLAIRSSESIRNASFPFNS
jgi:hypothetical protein